MASSTSSQSKTEQTQYSRCLGMSIHASLERVSSKFLCGGTASQETKYTRNQLLVFLRFQLNIFSQKNT